MAVDVGCGTGMSTRNLFVKFSIAKFTFDPAGAKRIVNSYSNDGMEM